MKNSLKFDDASVLATLVAAALVVATSGCESRSDAVSFIVDPTVESEPLDSTRNADQSVQSPQNAQTSDGDVFEIGGKRAVASAERALFNGENLDGWTNANGTAPGNGWRAESGILRLMEPGNAGDLLTNANFTNFVLDFEWRFGRECNSGVKYKLARPDGKGWLGLEYQIQDDANVEDGKIADRRTASLFDVLAASEPTNAPLAPTDATPSGNFRRGRIVVFGKNVEHWIDGERVLAFEIGTDVWNAAKSDSKYKNQASFGETESGPIMLQDHQHPIDFRNVKIRELTAI